jgi:hypothetical protein
MRQVQKTLRLTFVALVIATLSACAVSAPTLPPPAVPTSAPLPGAAGTPTPTPTPTAGEPTPTPTVVPTPQAEAANAGAPASLVANPVGRFGPTGRHWPAQTPRPTDTFDQTVTVPANWDAIAAAIRNAPAGKVAILVQPGTLPAGHGANSSDPGVLADLGSASRQTRILVMPRDGFGTVKGSGTIAQGDASGYAFVNVNGVSLVGFDFGEQTVTFRNSQNSAFAWSTFGLLNVVASKGSVDRFQLVEVVAADIDDFDGDRAAFRTGSGFSISNVDIIGSYFAPVYKRAGSDAHSDTLQFSGSGPISGVNVVDSVFFHSSSQIFMCEQLSHLKLSNSLLLGDQGAARYVISGDRHQIQYTNALWGGSTGSVAENSIIIGSVNSAHQFDSVTNTRVSQPTSARVTSGTFTVDRSPVTKAWLDGVSPYPNRGFLAGIWRL